jgi:hypothetical protein
MSTLWHCMIDGRRIMNGLCVCVCVCVFHTNFSYIHFENSTRPCTEQPIVTYTLPSFGIGYTRLSLAHLSGILIVFVVCQCIAMLFLCFERAWMPSWYRRAAVI